MAQIIILKIHKGGLLIEEKQISHTPVVLGSSEVEAHVILRGDVSSVHARIEKRGDQFVICDMGSERGTFKNLDKILEAQLNPEDKISIGEFSIEFDLEEVSEPVSQPQVSESDDLQQTPPVEEEESSHEPDPEESVSEDSSVKVSSSDVKKESTFAPPSPYKSIDEFVKPSKGTTVEVLVAWRERIISAHHFSKNGSVIVGIDPSCDVIVPLVSSNVPKVPLLQINNHVQIILYPGMEGVLISDKQHINFNQLSTIGRGSGRNLVLKQDEMARVQLGGELELVVRYSPQAPRPTVVPFVDLSSNGFLAILLAIVLSGILMLWVALNRLDKIDRPDEEEFRTALIITNPPKPPPKTKVKKHEPPKPEKKKVKKIKKIVKIVKPKPKPKLTKKKLKKKLKIDVSKKKRKRIKKKSSRSNKVVARRGSGPSGTSRALRKKPGPRTNQVTSVKKGGGVKTGNKQGAQMRSKKKLEKSGIFSAFGGGGRNNRLDQSSSGQGELAGLADQASGSAGFAENRPGEGLGSRFKDTGGGRGGRSNVGVSGLKANRKKGLGISGVGGGSLGDRKSLTIIPGGGGEEFSGQIDRAGIRRVFVDNARAIRSCYERALNRNPSLGGILKLNFDIGERGTIMGRPSINWGDSSVKSRSLAGCILNRLKSWRFPEPPSNEIVNVIYPLAFSSK